MNALCSGCGRDIQFAKHEKSGKSAPLVRPLNGMKPNIFLYADPQTGEPTYRVVKDETAELVSHFSDCPNAARFRPSPKGDMP